VTVARTLAHDLHLMESLLMAIRPVLSRQRAGVVLGGERLVVENLPVAVAVSRDKVTLASMCDLNVLVTAEVDRLNCGVNTEWTR